MRREGLPVEDLTVSGELELRYRGQSDTLTVPYRPDFLSHFHGRHRHLYGHDFPHREVEALSLRLTFLAPAFPAALPRLASLPSARVPRPCRATVWLPEGPADLPVYGRWQLQPGQAFAGPALVVEDYATLLILPGFGAEVLPPGHLLLSR